MSDHSVLPLVLQSARCAVLELTLLQQVRLLAIHAILAALLAESERSIAIPALPVPTPIPLAQRAAATVPLEPTLPV